ncbi:hypothetical protein AC578_4226, partial [Pseudocercospora eumusae]
SNIDSYPGAKTVTPKTKHPARLAENERLVQHVAFTVEKLSEPMNRAQWESCHPRPWVCMVLGCAYYHRASSDIINREHTVNHANGALNKSSPRKAAAVVHIREVNSILLQRSYTHITAIDVSSFFNKFDAAPNTTSQDTAFLDPVLFVSAVWMVHKEDETAKTMVRQYAQTFSGISAEEMLLNRRRRS